MTSRTVLTDATGQVEIELPQDRAARLAVHNLLAETFEKLSVFND